MCGKLLMTVELGEGVIPAGYEPVAYRIPKDGEQYCNPHNHAIVSTGGPNDTLPRLILRKIEVWRPATFADLDKGLRCRVRDSYSSRWVEAYDTINKPKLVGWINKLWRTCNGAAWAQCEVLES